MKKTLTRVVALLSACLLTFGAGCNIIPTKKKDYDHTLWTSYNTLKVMQDSSFNVNYEQMPVGINVSMSKNESEMGSFYVTTGERDIDNFNLVASALTNENGDVLPVEQMKVYAQKYVEVTSKSQGNNLKDYPLGWMPDPLVPIELYRAEKEDKIEPNKNQGFSVDFTTTAQTPSGTYTGTFTLTLDEKVEKIPVSVEVWDFALPYKSAADSCVLIYDRQIAQSEGVSQSTEEFAQWQRTYYEQALEYKMNPYMVPNSLKGAKAFLADVKKYWNHPNFATYGMPHQSFISGTESVYMAYWRECLYEFAKASAEDKVDYLELTYFYPYDEPQDRAALEICIQWIEKLKNLMADVQAQIEDEGVFERYECSEEFTEKCKNSLLNIDIVITAWGAEEVLNDMPVTYCPTINHWGDSMTAENLYTHAEEFGTKLWYYTHIRPNYPAPTVHIDDYGLSTRIMKWIQKCNDLEAYLYYDYCSALWSNVKSQEFHGENRYEIVNKSPGLSANGDGFFVYPAAKYEADEPIISMRLVAYRDGQDDLDMLNYLDSLYSDYETYYDVEKGSFDVNNVIKGLYERIFVNINVMADDDQVFDQIRLSVKDLVLNAQNENGNKFIYLVDYQADTANYSFYTAPGCQVKINGEVITNVVSSGEGLKHTYSMNFANGSLLSSVEVVKDGESQVMQLFESSNTKGIDVSASDFVVEVNGDSIVNKNKESKSLEFTIKSKDYGKGKEYLTMLHVPIIEFKSLGQFSVLEYLCENNTNEDVEMKLTIVDVDGTTYTSDAGLPANTSRVIYCQNRLFGKEILSVSIEFVNHYVNESNIELLGDRSIVISNMRVRQ